MTKTRSRRRHGRHVLLALPAALLAASCSGGKTGGSAPPTSAPPGSIAALARGSTSISLIQAQSALSPGKDLFSFGLATGQGQLIQGGSPQVWAAESETGRALGPFVATFYTFEAGKRFKDKAPRSPLTGFYVAPVEIPTAGTWVMAATVSAGSGRAIGIGTMRVSTNVPARVGTKAISVATPVAHTEAGLRQICTRDPPDTMHSLSLDAALRNGKPTVVVFSTPLLCESRMCGPVTDEVYAAFRQVGAAKANFIHVEEFLPGPRLTPPPATEQNVSPGFKAWGFTTEPWVVVIDRSGTIRASFEGPVVEAEILRALRPLL